MENFFRTYWNTGVRKMKWFIVVSTFLWFFYAINRARQIGPLTEEEEFIPKDHPVMIPLNILGDIFTQSEDQNQKV